MTAVACECGRKIMTVVDVADHMGVSPKAVTQRLFRGQMDPEPWGRLGGRPFWLSSQWPQEASEPSDG